MCKRLDCVLVETGAAQSRERAKELIKAGHVAVNGQICAKPSTLISAGDETAVTGGTLEYVGRGGLKLAYALERFGISVDGLVCLDVGASTGGFTDCMLKNGAKKVYALDVGHSQLAEKLRADSRVINMEKTDIRGINSFDDVEFVGADVSFISLKLVLPSIFEAFGGGTAVVLVKPQFETGRKFLNKKGIVKDGEAARQTLEEITEFAETLGFTVAGSCESPLKGGSGNTEFLLILKK